jgi:hypothetical protein
MPVSRRRRAIGRRSGAFAAASSWWRTRSMNSAEPFTKVTRAPWPRLASLSTAIIPA